MSASVLTTGPTATVHRNSPIPNGAMVMTRFMELRKRRGLMIALFAVNIGVPSIFLALGVAIMVGVLFGLYPAMRAARLDPIEALRHD